MNKPIVLAVCLLCLLLPTELRAANRDIATKTSTARHVLAWHFVLRDVTRDRADWMVDIARSAGFNTVIVTITDGVNLQHAPWQSRSGSWSKDELRGWSDYARSKGIEVIPELKLLTHQEKLFLGTPDNILFNSSTYDPHNAKVYEKVFLLVDEVIDITKTHALHIGHDEVAGHSPKSENKWLRKGETMLPHNLFLQDTLKLHDYLQQHGIETWMWGDMLISPGEFTGMQPNSLHGQQEGYGKAMRDRLPKDIVICDWHYIDNQKDFPSLSAFAQEGFKVLGATWKKNRTIRNFSRYAAQHGATGMIATTWFHVQRKDWDIVKDIIWESGEIFRNDFPNAK